MQSKITPRPGGYNFQLVDYYTKVAPPQDIVDAVQAKLAEMRARATTGAENMRSSYRYSIMVLEGKLPPVRG